MREAKSCKVCRDIKGPKKNMQCNLRDCKQRGFDTRRKKGYRKIREGRSLIRARQKEKIREEGSQ